MRITKIAISNYRQHKNINIEFKKKGEHDLYLFVARNGVGKTNTLNAIYWCLYNQEPYLSIKNRGLPVLNKSFWNSTERRKTVSVEIHIQDTSAGTIIIKRTQDFDINQTNPQSSSILPPTSHESKLSIWKSYGGANPHEISDPDDTKKFIERVLPPEISEYFLFDGERLDNYFKESSGAKIKKAILMISKLDQLDRMIERLSILQKDFRTTMGRKNLSIEELGQKCDKLQKELDEKNREKVRISEELRDNRQRLNELKGELSHTPDIKKIERDLEETQSEIDKIQKELIVQKKRKKEQIYNNFIQWQFYPAMTYLKMDIDKKRRTKEIPVIQNKDVIEEIKKSHHCSICDRDLDSHAEDFIEELLKSFTLSTTISSELIGMDLALGNCIREFRAYFPTTIKEISSLVSNHEARLDKAEEKKEEYIATIKNFGDETIRRLQDERDDRESTIENLARNYGSLDEAIKHLIPEVEQAKRALARESEKVAKSEKSKQSYDVCEDAIQILEKSRENILNDIRSDIELETNKAFFAMSWKKSTFRDVKINNDYTVMLNDVNGLPALGSISKAENELLALAFTIALHKVSGFEAPIIIDTPVARISSEQREAFGTALVDVSKEKQLILLFTPDEYTENIRRVIEPIASQKYIYELSEDETETNLIVA